MDTPDFDELLGELEADFATPNVAPEPLPLPAMDVQYLPPQVLKANPWNPNQVDPINQMKLEASIQKDGIKRPIVVREVPEKGEGYLEIIGGQHRTLAAMALGLPQVPVINRGAISDAQAKKETLIDNFRYGSDDPLRFADLLQDPEIGSAEELLATMPIDEEELANYFSHLTEEDLSATVDSLLGDDADQPEVATLDLGATAPTRTHQIIRFKVSIEDGAKLLELIKKTRTVQGFTESDDMTNDGDALVFLLTNITK